MTPVVDDLGGRLNDALGGVARGSLILLTGVAASGKSTAAAELAAHAIERWAPADARGVEQAAGSLFWLDADQKDAPLVRQFFRDAGVEPSWPRVTLVLPRPARFSGTRALALVPSAARVVVMDALETWAPDHAGRLRLIHRLQEHGAWLKILPARTPASPEGGAG